MRNTKIGAYSTPIYPAALEQFLPILWIYSLNEPTPMLQNPIFHSKTLALAL
jgi:hypothetical protein